MTLFRIIFSILLGLTILGKILMIDDPREPYTKTEAFWGTILNGILIIGLLKGW